MAQKPKTYKFQSFKREALKRRDKAPARKVIPPFVIDDIEPPIMITEPDTLERQVVIADYVGQWQRGDWDMGNTIPLLKALCGDQFGRVWMLVKDDPDPAVLIPLINAMFDHFNSVIESLEEAAELPGGSEDSSN